MNDLEFNKRMDELVELLVGKKVINNGLGEGTVIEVGDRVTVEFSGTKKTLTRENFFNYNKPVDESLLSELDQATKAHDVFVEERRIEAEKHAKELAEQRRKNAAAAQSSVAGSTRKPKTKASFNSKFGKNYNVALLNRTPVMTYRDVEAMHSIKIAGFGRGINPKDDCVVLISTVKGSSDHFIYHDKWNLEGHYEFSGEGSEGDQTMTKGNKAILDAAAEGKPIFLYVKFGPEEYYPQGEMKLVEYKTVIAPDKNGNMRKEIMFILDRI